MRRSVVFCASSGFRMAVLNFVIKSLSWHHLFGMEKFWIIKSHPWSHWFYTWAIFQPHQPQYHDFHQLSLLLGRAVAPALWKIDRWMQIQLDLCFDFWHLSSPTWLRFRKWKSSKILLISKMSIRISELICFQLVGIPIDGRAK